jgi:hypothetical protein
MILVSAKSAVEAEEKLKRKGMPLVDYIFVPETCYCERIERLRGLYGQRKEDLIGSFSYAEIDHVCRKVG